MNRKSRTGYRLNKDGRVIPVARQYKSSWFFRLRGDFPGEQVVINKDFFEGHEDISKANNLNEIMCNEDGNMYRVYC